MRLVAFVIVDAVPAVVADRHDFLTSFLPYQCRARTILGYSSAAVPSLLTGVLPREHGRWNVYFRGRGPIAGSIERVGDGNRTLVEEDLK